MSSHRDGRDEDAPHTCCVCEDCAGAVTVAEKGGATTRTSSRPRSPLILQQRGTSCRFLPRPPSQRFPTPRFWCLFFGEAVVLERISVKGALAVLCKRFPKASKRQINQRRPWRAIVEANQSRAHWRIIMVECSIFTLPSLKGVLRHRSYRNFKFRSIHGGTNSVLHFSALKICANNRSQCMLWKAKFPFLM